MQERILAWLKTKPSGRGYSPRRMAVTFIREDAPDESFEEIEAEVWKMIRSGLLQETNLKMGCYSLPRI